MTSEELAREVEYHKLLDALAAAKKGKDRDKLQATKEAVFAFREDGRAKPSAHKAGEATPASLKVKAKVT